MNITITKGGERLYVYPFLRHIIPSKNRFHYLWSEMYPYFNQWSTVENTYEGGYLKQWFRSRRARLRWFWYSGAGKTIWILRYIFRYVLRWDDPRYAWAILRGLWQNRNAVGVFLAVDFPDLRLHIPHQISVHDPDNLVEEYYLTPSTKWIKQELELELSLAHREDERVDYHRWLMSVKPLTDTGDYEVDYIVVLDT